MTHVAVLGGGVIGVASAWYLAQSGFSVTLVERREGVGLETSYANGGQISVSHAEPWANPHAPLQALRWLGREDAPLLWRLRADAEQWSWGLRFLRECTGSRTRSNIAAILQLALYSRRSLQELRRELALEYDQLQRGILHIYSDAVAWRQALAQAEVMRRFGCERVEKSRDECLAIEPALAGARAPIIGGTYTAADESGDAHAFTRRLAARCAERGVEIRLGAAAAELIAKGDRIEAVRLQDGSRLEAGRYVVALGCDSRALLRPLGLRLPIYPAKGYSITVPIPPGAAAPAVSLTDDGHKLVFSRLGERLRVAGTAEFAGYDRSINAARCAAIERRAFALFPGLGGQTVETWSGLRPSTPGNVPIVGATRWRNLFVNSGHGTLGWTMACGSGRLLADLLSGREPEVDPAPYRPR